MTQLTKIAQFARPYLPELAGISLIILAIAGLRQVEPFVFRQITDNLVGNSSTKTTFLPSGIIGLLLVYLLVKILGVGLNRLSWYLATVFTYKLRFSLRETGYQHLLSLPMSFFKSEQSGKLMSQLDRGTTQITQIINNSGMFLLPNLATAVIGLVIVAHFNALISLTMVAIFIPVAVLYYLKFIKYQKYERQEYKLYDKQYGHFWETISAIELIKSFVAEAFELRQLRQFHQKIFRIRLKTERYHNLFVIADVFLESSIWFLYAWIVYLTYRGDFTLGTMVLMMAYVNIIREPLWVLNWTFWEAKRAQLGARDYFKILDKRSSIIAPKQPIHLKRIRGGVVFDKVSFVYEKGEKVLNQISFNVPVGTSCAFVGQSGTGKTTIAALMNRFFDVTEGKILIDGVDIRKFGLRELRRNIGLVSQEPYLFADTIEENLRYGNANASLRQMKLACQVANAHEFIKKLPHGYKTAIGERGVKLSGGQKQRLSLARVILKDPPILILDEATSQLDSRSEKLIQEALAKAIQGRTTIMIAHRLSTVKRSDKIIVIENQKIMEQGTHQELINNKKLYASLFALQAGDSKLLEGWDLTKT